MSDYKFIMPWPPTLNHFHQPIKVGKGVRITKSAKAREYAALAEARLIELGLNEERIPEHKRLEVKMVLNPPTLRSYDVDGRFKGILDALSEVNFYADDSQVVRLIGEKGTKTPGGNIEVTINILED